MCVEEEAKKPEETLKNSVQTLPDEFGTVPTEKPDLEPFIDDPLHPESDTKLEEYQNESRIKFGRIAHNVGEDK